MHKTLEKTTYRLVQDLFHQPFVGGSKKRYPTRRSWWVRLVGWLSTKVSRTINLPLEISKKKQLFLFSKGHFLRGELVKTSGVGWVYPAGHRCQQNKAVLRGLNVFFIWGQKFFSGKFWWKQMAWPTKTADYTTPQKRGVKLTAGFVSEILSRS